MKAWAMLSSKWNLVITGKSGIEAPAPRLKVEKREILIKPIFSDFYR
jgi:hypothetical protein